MSGNTQYAFGWLRDYPDFRDLTVTSGAVPTRALQVGETKSVEGMLKELGVLNTRRGPAGLPSAVDLRSSFSPVEDQQGLGSCTANAAVGLLEYFQNRAFGTYLNASRRFVYWTTRRLLGWTGDSGAYLRTTMGALTLFGAPPEKFWPYTDVSPDFDEPPSPFLYAFAHHYQALTYYRLDPPGLQPAAVLNQIKTNLAAKLPSMFGFTVCESMRQAGTTGKIPFPVASESVLGGHAIVAAGYDDTMIIQNAAPNGPKTTGALLIRNSWGTGWGDGGYGWLPYEYVLKQLAVDWWSLLRADWVATGQFGLDN